MKIFLPALALSLSVTAAFSQDRQQSLKEASQLVADSNYGKAITIYNRLLEADSADFEVYQKRGDLYTDMKDYQQAYKDYTYSIHYNRRYSLAWIQRASLLQRLDYYDKSLEDYNEALPLTDNNEMRILVLVDRAEIKRRLHRGEEAVVDLKKALTIDSVNLGVLANLGSTLSDLDRRPEAITYLEKAIRIDPAFEGGIGNLAFLYAEMGNYRKSIELDNQLLKLKPNEPFALNNRGYAKMQAGDLVGALEDINNSILILPYNSFAYRNRALLYIKQHKKTEACADLQKALDLNFTKDYGDEVEQLIKKNCQPETGGNNKM